MATGASQTESPDVAGNPLVQNLRINLGNAEGKLADMAQRLDRNHPSYIAAKAEVDKLRSDLNAAIHATLQQRG